MMPVTDTAADEDFEFDLWDELRPIIAAATTADPRSQQTEVGPSGLGTPCDRKLAHRLANTPPTRDDDIPWRPQVGKAVHTWLEGVFSALNEREFETMHALNVGGNQRCKAVWCDHSATLPYTYMDADGDRITPGAYKDARGHWHLMRYMLEFEIPVGTINGRVISGHVDVYDRHKKSIIDWKIAGPKSLKDHHAHGMGHEYRVQQHTYGYGVARLGLPVEKIALCFLPMSGELKDGYVLAEPFDLSVRTEAFHRARDIEAALKFAATSKKPKTLRRWFRALPTAPDYCQRCPWFAPGAQDFEAACPGDPSLYENIDDPDREWDGIL